MGLLDRLRGGGKVKEEESVTQGNIATGMVYTRHNSAQESEDRQAKGIDIDMIDPEEITKEFEAIAFWEEQKAVEVDVTDKDGNTVFEQAPMKDTAGNIVYQDVPKETNGVTLVLKQVVYTSQAKRTKALVTVKHERPWAIATLGYLNKVWPTIWMTPWEADTTKLRIRTAFHDIRKAMTYQEKKTWGVVLRMARDLCLARCEDMKDGHKPLLLKVKREELGVHMSKGERNMGGASK